MASMTSFFKLVQRKHQTYENTGTYICFYIYFKFHNLITQKSPSHPGTFAIVLFCTGFATCLLPVIYHKHSPMTIMTPLLTTWILMAARYSITRLSCNLLNQSHIMKQWGCSQLLGALGAAFAYFPRLYPQTRTPHSEDVHTSKISKRSSFLFLNSKIIQMYKTHIWSKSMPNILVVFYIVFYIYYSFFVCMQRCIFPEVLLTTCAFL